MADKELAKLRHESVVQKYVNAVSGFHGHGQSEMSECKNGKHTP